MKTSSSGTKSRNKELNSSKLSISSTIDHTDLEGRIKKLETSLTKMAMQNELLHKRIDTLETKGGISKTLSKSHSLKFNQFKTIQTKDFDLDESPSCPQTPTICATQPEESALVEWKKDIEHCISKLSDKVAQDKSSIMTGLLETRIIDLTGEVTRLKNGIDDFTANSEAISKMTEKYERTEKLVSELMNHITNMKTNILKWQNDFKSEFKEINEKLGKQEKVIEVYAKLETSSEKKLDRLVSDFKLLQDDYYNSVEGIKDMMNKKLSFLDQNINTITEENTRISSKLRHELSKIEVSIKAIWDSLALFTSTAEYNN